MAVIEALDVFEELLSNIVNVNRHLGLSPLEAASWVLASCYVAAVALVYALGIRLTGPSPETGRVFTAPFH